MNGAIPLPPPPICLHGGDRHNVTFNFFFYPPVSVAEGTEDWRHSCTPSCVSPVPLALRFRQIESMLNYRHG